MFRSLKELSDQNEYIRKTAELLDLLISTQQRTIELTEENIQLKKSVESSRTEIESLKKAKEEFAMYDLIDVGDANSKVYQHRETEHQACPKCFEDGKIKTLQRSRFYLICKACNTHYNLVQGSVR